MSEEDKALVTRFLDLTTGILMKEKAISKFCFTIKHKNLSHFLVVRRVLIFICAKFVNLSSGLQ
ncbi:hypothetical protein SAMN05421846_110120 [Chryseobacterium taeanense]|uniref:Uncharacterized protein n=1 Tax=Chryseobacterium taeanense TaxID=311334 RepID=A0A1G8LZH1_9FLAO|nr:hypothetical protein SAMN05421846_110120 [Chryseobacterium taeanense]